MSKHTVICISSVFVAEMRSIFENLYKVSVLFVLPCICTVSKSACHYRNINFIIVHLYVMQTTATLDALTFNGDRQFVLKSVEHA